MKPFSYILRSLVYFRKAHLSTLAGIIISSAVLTGALLVGDSVKQSLISLVDIRLGNTHIAISSPERLIQSTLADSLELKTGLAVTPVLLSEAIASQADKQLQLNKVQVLGIDSRFFSCFDHPDINLSEDEALISYNLAKGLQLNKGDEFLLKIRIPFNHPENSPFVAAETRLATIKLKVKAIAEADAGGQFNLKNNQVAPFNVLISLRVLSQLIENPGKANLFLLSGNIPGEALSSAIQSSLTPSDVGIYFTTSKQRQLKSDRIFIDQPTADLIKNEIRDAHPFMTYLVNSLSHDKQQTPYSFVAAADDSYLKSPLKENEIIISSWLADDLEAVTGDTLVLSYFILGAMRQLVTDSTAFVVKEIVAVGDPRFDPALMPDFPGLTEAGNCSDWETGVPIRMDRIRDKDEEYWNQYRGTPKAFISLESGQKIWGNAFGKYTSFACKTDSIHLAKLSQRLAKKIPPAGNGFIIQDVRSAGLRAASLSTDFGELFLSLGFFIVVAGLLLLALVFSLHLSKRGLETAVLSTLGISRKLIIRLFFMELGLLAITGSIAGALLGILYNRLMILGLNTIWMGAVGPTSLTPHVSLQSLVIGFIINVVITVFTMYRIVYRRLNISPVQQIKGNVTFASVEETSPGKWQSILLIAFSLLFLALFLYGMLTSGQGFMLPLAAGGLLFVVLLLFISRLITKSSKSSGSISGILQLALKQWSGHKSRTLTTLALLALGTFTIFITGSQQRSSFEGRNVPGTGGFLLWAETTVPIQEDLNSTDGRQKNSLADEPLLDSVRFMQLPVVEGDDASCLNLNAISTPTLLGVVPTEFNKRPSLEFVSFTADISPSETWMVLSNDSGTYIPVIADQTVITWSLLKKIGDTLHFQSETGEPLHLILKAGLRNSIFQGNILMDEKIMKKYYPSRYRSKLLLIDGPVETRDTLVSRLNYLLGNKGITIMGTDERMASFNAVQNTYLSIFMLLGGLAVVISVAGLGIILLKNIHERKQELAVMQAIGFHKTQLIRMIVAEHLSLLFCGLIIGLLCSFSTLLLMGAHTMILMPWGEILWILILILLAGTAWITLPAYHMLKQNLIHSLRNE